MSRTIRELIHFGQEELAGTGIHDAAFDSKALLSFAMGIPFREVMSHLSDEVGSAAEAEFCSLIEKRRSGEPLQYITNEQEFMGLPFYVDERVLIPRLDTEILADAAVQYIKERIEQGDFDVKRPRVLDLCCGSGAIGLSIAADCKVELVLSDVSHDTLDVARINAKRLGLSDSMRICESDLFEALCEEPFDLIVSNPPYVRSNVIKTLDREVKDHEPMLALDGGADGLDVYRRIIKGAPAHLSTNGCLIMEIGCDQAEDITGMLKKSSEFVRIDILKDLAGLDRVVVSRK